MPRRAAERPLARAAAPAPDADGAPAEKGRGLHRSDAACP